MVASPLRRTIRTALLSFEPVFEAHKDFKLVLLPEAQETSDVPCDTGSDPAVLQTDFVDRGQPVDLSLVHEGWNSKVTTMKLPSQVRSELTAFLLADWKVGPDTVGLEKQGPRGKTVVEGSSGKGGGSSHAWWHPALHHRGLGGQQCLSRYAIVCGSCPTCRMARDRRVNIGTRHWMAEHRVSKLQIFRFGRHGKHRREPD